MDRAWAACRRRTIGVSIAAALLLTACASSEPAAKKVVAPRGDARASDRQERVSAVELTPREGDRIRDVRELAEGRYRVIYASGVQRLVEVSGAGFSDAAYRVQDDDAELLNWINQQVIRDPANALQQARGAGGRGFGIRERRLFEFNDEGKVLRAAEVAPAGDVSIVDVAPDGSRVLVAVSKLSGITLAEVRASDFAALRQVVVPAKERERYARLSSAAGSGWALQLGDHVYVAALLEKGLWLRRLSRSDLRLDGELFVPLASEDPDFAENDVVWLQVSAGARWLSVQRASITNEQVVVVDVPSLRIAQTVASSEATVGFSADERVLALTTGERGVREETFVPIGEQKPVLRVHDAELDLLGTAPGIVWGVSKGLKRARVWSFADLAHAHELSLRGAIRGQHSAPFTTFVEDPTGRRRLNGDAAVWNYPVDFAFTGGAEVLVAESDGRQLMVSRVRERGAETLLLRDAPTIVFVAFALGADALVTMTREGVIRREPLSSLRPVAALAQ